MPNFLSLSRVAWGALFICIYSNEQVTSYLAGVTLLLIALATDIFDGILARRLKVDNQEGYLLDGLGDRSIYIALILTFYEEHRVAGILAWLLIMREISIYAIRVIETEWTLKLHGTRFYSLAHALLLRSWFGVLLIIDAVQVFGVEGDRFVAIIGPASYFLLIGALLAGYVSIYSTLSIRTKNHE